ncbi:MAG: ribonuclease D [Proteobacteria bacterium]|nr:ribonuclease D [Pseudomonadota bacterium]
MNNIPALAVRMINDQAGLANAISQIAGSPMIGLDTEFRREDTYYSQLCLMQIATRHEIFLIDNLAIPDLAPLFELLADRQQLKIMHSARQDLELLLQFGDKPLQPVFDTQIAAACLGNNLQLGYSTLVEQLTGVSIDKSQTRTQWCKRPLTQAQLDYAAEDVLYLIPMMERLQAQITSSDRERWFEEDSLELYNRELYEQDDDTAWQRVKGAGKLEAKQRMRLKALADWREKTAKQENRPRQWIVRDSPLIELACRNPEKTEDLAGIKHLPAGKLRRYGSALLKALIHETGESVPGNSIARPGEAERALLRKLKLLQKQRAEELKVEPELLAGRRDLKALARGETNTRVTRGWRREVLGNDLLAIAADPARQEGLQAR